MITNLKRRFSAFAAILTLITVVFCTAAYAAAQEDCAYLALRLPETDADPYSEDCPMGSFCADALRSRTGADIAIVPGGAVKGSLPQGALVPEDVADCYMPDGSAVCAAAECSPQELGAFLEELFEHIVIDYATETIDREASAFGGFPNISGMSIVYDASAQPGERVVSITLDDGTELDTNDTQTVLTLVSDEAYLSGEYTKERFEAQLLPETCPELVYGYISECGRELQMLDWDRVRAIGANDNKLISAVPVSTLLIAAGALMAILFVFRRKLEPR